MPREIELLPESTLHEVVDFFVRVVEAFGAVIIFVGALVAVAQLLRVAPRRDPHEFVRVRLTLGRFLALGLEFQLASDVLAAVAAIRTALNYFLAKEIKEEQLDVEEVRRARAAAREQGAT